MGRSTVDQLITRGKNMNEYNNTGLDTTSKWIDYMNEALGDLADDLFILESLPPVSFVPETREYTLPSDFLQLYSYTDSSNAPVMKRRTYEDQCQGYFILNKGGSYVVDLYRYTSPDTFSGLYQRYPALLTASNINANPEVPTLGENALIYYAIAKGLRNNNLPGQAQEVEAKYEIERKKIRTAAYQAMHGVMG